MPIQLIGVGVGRTGTHSLKLAIEHLLGGTCHHMMEVDEKQVPIWHDAYLGTEPNWDRLLGRYNAIVDWPGAGLWWELTTAYPDVPVLLSTRSSTEVWWKSANATIFPLMRKPSNGPARDMTHDMIRSFCADWPNEKAVKASYEAHNEVIRDVIAPDRLFEYQPGDGWGPLCAALGRPEPDEPFPHSNSTDDFQARVAEAKAATRKSE